MGKKKKKGLSNRLAKMSDEERARYLQHKAQIEEEGRRRKEQLISTFMKNKIKKEDTFARLNIAKINEYWHQILRKVAFGTMKSEILNLGEWIKRVVDLKNKIISQLITELDEAEIQYEHNLKSHLNFIDQFLDMHHHGQEYFRRDYEIKSLELYNDRMMEMCAIQEKTGGDFHFLRVILFGLESDFGKTLKVYKNKKELLLEDFSTSSRHKHQAMVNDYISGMDKLWQDIYMTLNDYLNRTATKRHHYIELKHLDDRNKAERDENDRKIAKYTETLSSLKSKHSALKEEYQERLINMTAEEKQLRTEYTKLKRQLNSSLNKFDKKIVEMTLISNGTLDKLKKIKSKGEMILQIHSCCRKLETDEEKSRNWAKQRKNWYILYDIVDRIAEEQVEEEESKTVIKEVFQEEVDESQVTLVIPKATVEKKETLEISETSKEIVNTENTDGIELLNNYNYLNDLKDLWWIMNRVEMDIMDLKEEKKKLLVENTEYKKIIKNILLDAALQPPKTEKSSRPMIRQGVLSAPPSLSSSKFAPQIPNQVVIEF